MQAQENTIEQTVTSGVKKIGSGVVSVFNDFKTFVNKGNVVQIAVGIIIGAAFTNIVNSFNNDLLTPIIGLAIQKQLFNGFIPLREPLVCIPGKIEYNKGICEALKPTLTTPALYQEAGGVTFNYGSFLQNVIDFFIIAFVLFLVIKAYTFKLRPIKEGVPTTKECPFCCKDVAIEAIRFAFCTSRFEKASSSNSVLIKMD